MLLEFSEQKFTPCISTIVVMLCVMGIHNSEVVIFEEKKNREDCKLCLVSLHLFSTLYVRQFIIFFRIHIILGAWEVNKLETKLFFHTFRFQKTIEKKTFESLRHYFGIIKI